MGDGTGTQRSLPLQVPGMNAIAIAAGRHHSLALKADGTVWAWGYNGYGQLGNGNTAGQTTPVKISTLTNIIAIATGDYHSLALKADGTVWAWGNNTQGQLGIGTMDGNAHATPVQTGTLSLGTGIAANTHSIAVKSDGTVWIWGYNEQGQIGNGSITNASTPQLSLFSFGLASPIATPVMQPLSGAYLIPQTIIISSATPETTIRYTTNGVDPTETDPAITDSTNLTAPIGITLFKARAFKTGVLPSEIKTAVYQIGEKAISGYTHSLAIRLGGNLWLWGNNNKGQLGNGTTLQKIVPVQLTSVGSVKEAAGGYEHSIVLKSDGTVRAWGRNSEGQLGDGSLTQRNTPVLVRGLNNIVQVRTGYYHSLGIKDDSTLWSWGYNNYGQLGNGTNFHSTAAKQITALAGIMDAAGGEEYSIALSHNGALWTWGRNNQGQLGDGTNTSRNLPGEIPGLNAIAIAAGRYHCLALAANGTVWAWGYNGYGQLGNGNSTNQNRPIQVNGLTNIVAIATGENHSVAIKNDGTVWAWGRNNEGQLGNITFNTQYTPVQVMGIALVSSISAGNQTLFVTPLPDKQLFWASGKNSNGQIGDSTLLNRNSRVLVHFPVDQNSNGIADWEELPDAITGDIDRDGLFDWEELLIYRTDFTNFDMNGDGLADGVNFFVGLHPLLADTDGDGIPNIMEILMGTSPILADSDFDGVPDNLDPFPMDRFRKTLPALNPTDHTPPVVILKLPF